MRLEVTAERVGLVPAVVDETEDERIGRRDGVAIEMRCDDVELLPEQALDAIVALVKAPWLEPTKPEQALDVVAALVKAPWLEPTKREARG